MLNQLPSLEDLKKNPLPMFSASSLDEAFPFMLLYCLCMPGMDHRSLCQWLDTLKNKWGADLWKAPVISHQSLQAILKFHPQPHWKLKESFPGLVWSVGVFVRKYSLNMLQQMSAKQLQNTLVTEIFGLSRQSQTQNRLRWIWYFLHTPTPIGFDFTDSFALDDRILPWAPASKALDRVLRKHLNQPYQKDLLPLEAMKLHTRRALQAFGKDEIRWIPCYTLYYEGQILALP